MGLFQRKNNDFSEAHVSNYDERNKNTAKGHHSTSPLKQDVTRRSPTRSIDSTDRQPSVKKTLNLDDISLYKQEEYSISDLINLFHSLPQQQLAAKISTVVGTIASFDVNIQNLIEDLVNQESLAKKRVKVLELEIELFKAKIKNRKRELDLLQIGICELAKSRTYLQRGMAGISEEQIQHKQRTHKKKAANLKKNTKMNGSLPIAEKIRIATTTELQQGGSGGKIQSLRNKFKNRLF